MRPNNFPQARDYVHSVSAKQLASKRFEISGQLSKISNALQNFHERCDLNGVLEIDVSTIGDTIYNENLAVIKESGWKCYKRDDLKWSFFIAGQNEV